MEPKNLEHPQVEAAREELRMRAEILLERLQPGYKLMFKGETLDSRVVEMLRACQEYLQLVTRR